MRLFANLPRGKNTTTGLAIAVLALLLCPLPVRAQTYTWTGGGANDLFSNTANWQGGQVPVTADNNAFDDFWVFGSESGANPNYVVTLNQGGGNPPSQSVGRITWTASALSYTMNRSGNEQLMVYGTSSSPASDFLALANLSSNRQFINIPTYVQTAGNIIQRQVWDSGSGGVTFQQTVFFANKSKDVYLKGSGGFTFTNIDNTTGSATKVLVGGPGVVEVTGVMTQINQIRVEGGTLLLSGSGTDIIADTNAKTTGLDLAGGTLAFGTSNVNRFAEFKGSLTLTANSVIDMGSISQTTGSILEFLPAPNFGSSTLVITNWNGTEYTGGGIDQIRFASIGGYQINTALPNVFFDLPGKGLIEAKFVLVGGKYELVPVPEPSTYAAAALLLGCVGLHFHRRRKAAQAATAVQG
jgi:hypothetical protein